MSSDRDAATKTTKRVKLPNPEVEPWREALSHISSAEMIGHCLVLRVAGRIERKAYLRFLDEMFDLIDAHAPKAVLVDLRSTTGLVSDSDRFEVNAYHAKKSLELKSRAKLVCCTREDLFDPRRFSQTVAKNRGLHYEYTASIEDALQMAGLSIEPTSLYP